MLPTGFKNSPWLKSLKVTSYFKRVISLRFRTEIHIRLQDYKPTHERSCIGVSNVRDARTVTDLFP